MKLKQFFRTNSRAINTNLGVLGLVLHSSSLESVNSFGAQSSLGGTIFVWGAQAVIWGARLRNALLRGAGHDLQSLDYRSNALLLELDKTYPSMLNFSYLNPATCLFYDFSNKSIMMFLTCLML